MPYKYIGYRGGLGSFGLDPAISTLPAGAEVVVPAGTLITVVSTSDVKNVLAVFPLAEAGIGTVPGVPVTGTVANGESVMLSSSVAIGFQSTTRLAIQSRLPTLASGRSFATIVPSGTTVLIRMVDVPMETPPSLPPPIEVGPANPTSQSDCPAGSIFHPSTDGDPALPARCLMPESGGGGTTPWYKRTSTYVAGGLAGLALLAAIVVLARAKK
jgi:hypothetical protein